MKTKFFFAAMLAVAGFAFSSCDDGKTGDTKESIELSVYPSDSPDAASYAEYVRQLYQDNIGDVAKVTCADVTPDNSERAVYKITYAYNDANYSQVTKGLTAVKNSTTALANKMGTSIWHTDAILALGYEWSVEQNMAAGTWTGEFLNTDNEQTSVTFKFGKEFKNYTYDNSYKYTGSLEVTVNGQTITNGTAYYSKFSYAMENNTPTATYNIKYYDYEVSNYCTITFKCTTKAKTMTISSFVFDKTELIPGSKSVELTQK